MTLKKDYIAIDYFRIVAALLVVANHTSPFTLFGEFPDYMFANIAARLGVAFFFGATGFFLLVPTQNTQKSSIFSIRGFIKKTACIYGVAVLLYLPVNYYAGHFDAIQNPGDITKMVLMDGTMYHLWYLPAVIFGVVFVWEFLQYTNAGAAVILSVLLYIIGGFGDSYYGITVQIPALKAVYDGIFAICNYTRNGLFYAPVFLVTGLLARKYYQRITFPRALIGGGIAFALFLVEGALLFNMRSQTHESMYLLLPACIFFLLCILSKFRGVQNKGPRDVSLIIYIIHPLVIILVRAAGKLTGLSAFMVDNSLIHYVLVCIGSTGIATILLLLKEQIMGRNKKQEDNKRAWIEIDMRTLQHNIKVLKKMVPPECQLMPAVKGNAYGLGAVPICKELNKAGVRSFCVAALSEAIELRRNGMKGEILVLGYTPPENFRLLRKYRLVQTVVDYAYASLLNEFGKRLAVHIKVDTGMNRLGERSENLEIICGIYEMENLDIQGIFTQLSSSDSKEADDVEFSRMQIDEFWDTVNELEYKGFRVLAPHILCSYGMINYPQTECSYARPGLALYGIVDKELCLDTPPPLRTIFVVKANIALTKTVYPGERVGYGRAFVSEEKKKIAVVTMGYADGLPRQLSCKAGGVLINGEYAPFLGYICMDQAIIDVSHIENVKAGDTVTIIGKDGEKEISVYEFARAADTIPNEIVTRFGRRIQRFYVGK